FHRTPSPDPSRIPRLIERQGLFPFSHQIDGGSNGNPLGPGFHLCLKSVSRKIPVNTKQCLLSGIQRIMFVSQHIKGCPVYWTFQFPQQANQCLPVSFPGKTNPIPVGQIAPSCLNRRNLPQKRGCPISVKLRQPP